MIDPDALLAHARELAGAGKGRPTEVNLRRGVSAAYYAVFHDFTDRAARHLLGAATPAQRNAIRRSWTHGELAKLADEVVDRAKALARDPKASLPKRLLEYGPLVDICAIDPHLVTALRLFGQLQAQRHRADYDHDAKFDKASLMGACQDAGTARAELAATATVAQQALFTALTLKRGDFRERS